MRPKCRAAGTDRLRRTGMLAYYMEISPLFCFAIALVSFTVLIQFLHQFSVFVICIGNVVVKNLATKSFIGDYVFSILYHCYCMVTEE